MPPLDEGRARHHACASGGRDPGQAAKAKNMSAEPVSSRIPAIQLCYVRLAVSQPQAAATFATEILGLQHVPNKLEPFLFRSDERYHTLCLAAGTQRSSIGIEIAGEAGPDRVPKALAGGGICAREVTEDECAQ